MKLKVDYISLECPFCRNLVDDIWSSSTLLEDDFESDLASGDFISFTCFFEFYGKCDCGCKFKFIKDYSYEDLPIVDYTELDEDDEEQEERNIEIRHQESYGAYSKALCDFRILFKRSEDTRYKIFPANMKEKFMTDHKNRYLYDI